MRNPGNVFRLIVDRAADICRWSADWLAIMLIIALPLVLVWFAGAAVGLSKRDSVDPVSGMYRDEESRFSAAKKLFDKKDLVNSEDAFNKALHRYPDNAVGYFYLAEIYKARSDCINTVLNYSVSYNKSRNNGLDQAALSGLKQALDGLCGNRAPQ